MKILFLGYSDSELISFLREEGNEVIQTQDKIDTSFVLSNNFERIISYGYGHIIREPILTLYAGRIINLHISFLPWNRGAGPNFWSIIEGSPKGVTIHLVDKGIDTGDILVQEEVEIREDSTLRETYNMLQETIQTLFKNNWLGLKDGSIVPRRQLGKGSYHQRKDKENFIKEISDTWLDIKISELKKHVHQKMNREYVVLNKQKYESGAYSMIPIRAKDKYDIMRMRNEQIYHLRQAVPLTRADQDLYFETVVDKLFEEQKPGQILFSYLHDEVLVGYGGLVHINWIDRNAEISFIIETHREKEFSQHWTHFLKMLTEMTFEDLGLHKFFTYAFNLRPHLYAVLEQNGFTEEARLKEHCWFEDKFIDVAIHSKINQIEVSEG